jgi:hypothetical protein
VKPNLAFGPIDSVAQYLLYLSVVVLGVLLPLLLQRWRTKREKAALLERTLKSIDAEIAANHRRVTSSRATLVHLLDTLVIYRDHRMALRKQMLDPGGDVVVPPTPPDTEYGINVPLLTRTAWQVASHAQALVLLPEAQLNAYTRAYQMHEIFTADRSALLHTLMEIEQLELPADMLRPETVETQLRLLTLGLATVRYQVGLADSMLEAYNEALALQRKLAT